MDFVFGFAGIPDEVLDGVRKEKQSIAGQNARSFTVSHGPNGTRYQYKHVSRATTQFVQHLRGEFGKVNPDASIALCYVEQQGIEGHVLHNALFPHVFMVPIKWEMGGYDKHALGKAKNELVRELRLVCNEARKALNALKRELTEAAQRTPLLLPYRNFESRYLLDQLKEVQSSLLSGNNKFAAISASVERFRHHHPPQKSQDGYGGGRRFFVDARGIQFRPPGRELHGLHRPSEKHSDLCFISGVRRLGAPYAPAFHYDCQKGEPFTASFYDCHTDTKESLPIPKHINIAPNDNFRLGKAK